MEEQDRRDISSSLPASPLPTLANDFEQGDGVSFSEFTLDSKFAFKISPLIRRVEIVIYDTSASKAAFGEHAISAINTFCPCYSLKIDKGQSTLTALIACSPNAALLI